MIRLYRSIIIPVWRPGASQGLVTLSAEVGNNDAITAAILDATAGTEGTVVIDTLGFTFSVALPGTVYSQSRNIPRSQGITWGALLVEGVPREMPLKDGAPFGLKVQWINPDGVMNTEQRAIREASR